MVSVPGVSSQQKVERMLLLALCLTVSPAARFGSGVCPGPWTHGRCAVRCVNQRSVRRHKGFAGRRAPRKLVIARAVLPSVYFARIAYHSKFKLASPAHLPTLCRLDSSLLAPTLLRIVLLVARLV